MRSLSFQIGDYYHIYNRGAGKEKIFFEERDYVKFMQKLNTCRSSLKNEKISNIHDSGTIKENEVDLLSYCLLPNHFHLLLRQNAPDGISKYMHRLQMGYSKYVNTKNKRSGALFESEFQAARISSTDKLARVTAYINGNPEIHMIAKAETWKWSSCRDYLGISNGDLCDKGPVSSLFDGMKEYANYLKSVIAESIKQKEAIRELALEDW